MNDFRHFEQLKLPTVVLEIYEGRNAFQVSVVVFCLFWDCFFFFCFHTWAVCGKGMESIHIKLQRTVNQWLVRHSVFWMSIY